MITRHQNRNSVGWILQSHMTVAMDGIPLRKPPRNDIFYPRAGYQGVSKPNNKLRFERTIKKEGKKSCIFR